MSSRLTLATLGMAVLTLTGCGPTPGPAPTPIETVAEATSTPTATPTPTRADLVLPTCDELFSPEQVLELMGEGMVGETGSGGTMFDELRPLLDAPGTLQCAWVLPASERFVSVSIREFDEATAAIVGATMNAAGSTGTNAGGDSIIYAVAAEETEERLPFAEAHYLAVGLWVAASESHGTFAGAMTQAAMDRLAELNPTWFTVP
jgi:hypothetical protein